MGNGRSRTRSVINAPERPRLGNWRRNFSSRQLGSSREPRAVGLEGTYRPGGCSWNRGIGGWMDGRGAPSRLRTETVGLPVWALGGTATGTAQARAERPEDMDTETRHSHNDGQVGLSNSGRRRGHCGTRLRHADVFSSVSILFLDFFFPDFCIFSPRSVHSESRFYSACQLQLRTESPLFQTAADPSAWFCCRGHKERCQCWPLRDGFVARIRWAYCHRRRIKPSGTAVLIFPSCQSPQRLYVTTVRQNNVGSSRLPLTRASEASRGTTSPTRFLQNGQDNKYCR